MKKAIVLIMAMLSSQLTFALDLNCTGKVPKVQVTNFTGVYIVPDWHSTASVAVCRLDGTWKNVPASVCEQWVAGLQSASYLNKTVVVKYTATAAASCDAMPNGGAAEAPYHIEFRY